MTADLIDVALRVVRVLEEHDVRYVVGGSLASSISGEPRATLDVDLVVALSTDQVESLVAALGEEFYADSEAIQRAIREKSSANLIHLTTSIKVDLFVMGGRNVPKLDRQGLLACDAIKPAVHSDWATPELPACV